MHSKWQAKHKIYASFKYIFEGYSTVCIFTSYMKYIGLHVESWNVYKENKINR